jgi:hypothetical protein
LFPEVRGVAEIEFDPLSTSLSAAHRGGLPTFPDRLLTIEVAGGGFLPVIYFSSPAQTNS